MNAIRPVGVAKGGIEMKYGTLVAIIAIAISSPLLAEDQSSGRSQQPYLPTLADIMGAAQLRHFKLWYAGEVGNWDLAKYELRQIQTSIEDASRHFPNIPAADMTIMTDPVQEVRNAIDARSTTIFFKAFEAITSACNSCHRSSNVGFIVITVPRLSPTMTSPFSDQSFSNLP
jgi:hypothetical protein